jgi:hypothetical protein
MTSRGRNDWGETKMKISELKIKCVSTIIIMDITGRMM